MSYVLTWFMFGLATDLFVFLTVVVLKNVPAVASRSVACIS